MENGKINKLTVKKKEAEGYTFEDEKGMEVFLTSDEVNKELDIDESLDLFIYKDKSRRFSTALPYAQVDEYCFLNVKFFTEKGAFVDWGLDRDLFVPREEQMEELKEGQSYVFFIYEDEDTGDIRGSQRIEDFVFTDDIDVARGDEVDLLIYRESNLGFNVIINNLFRGLIFKSDVHKEVVVGEQLKGYVKQVREDGKIDILLEPLGYKKSVVSNTDLLLTAIKDAGAFLALTDKSAPEEIKKKLGLSKKAFKRAAGHLYKNKQIEIKQDGLYLVESKG